MKRYANKIFLTIFYVFWVICFIGAITLMVNLNKEQKDRLSEIEKNRLLKIEQNLDIENTGSMIKLELTDENKKEEVIFSVEDPSIVEVNENGDLVSLKEGSTKVTVTTKDNNKSQTITVNVGKEAIEDYKENDNNTPPIQEDNSGQNTENKEETGNSNPEVIEPLEIKAEKITLNHNKVTLYVGDEINLTYVIEPEDITNKNVTWQNTNTKVVSNNNGKLKALKEGTATITVKTSNGKISTCTITVKKKEENKEVENIYLNYTSKSIKEGNSSTLVATISPTNAINKTITWTSSNTNVATVNSSGVVTGKKEGTATITVKTTNGKVATCKITVTPKTIAVSGIKLNYTSATIKEGSSSALVATITPSNATNKTITWTSSNTSVATVDSSGKVTGKKAGTVTITAKTSNGKVATSKITITKKISKKYTVTFDKNGADSVSDSSVSCTISDVYNGKVQENRCNVKLATITRNGAEIIGWSTNKDAESKMYSSGETISINGNITLYAITRLVKPYTAKFVTNTAASISSNSKSCYVYNKSTTCSILTPTIKPKSGYSVVGWNYTKTMIDNTIAQNVKINLTKDVTYYAITLNTSNLDIYVNPTGNDSNNGIFFDLPIKTLCKAQDVLTKVSKYGTINKVNVHIASGTYNGQTHCSWTSNIGKTINITGNSSSIPVFKGASGNSENFLSIYNKNGNKFNIKNIKVTNYLNGIYIRSEYNDNKGYNTIDSVTFYQIGDAYTTTTATGYRALGINASSYNVIKNCTFSSIKNVDTSGLYIHGIYIVNNSSYNNIYNNKFEDIKPDPIRIRNNSNSNDIYNNTFTNTGNSAYCSDWHKASGESISKGNLFHNNTLKGGYGNKSIKSIVLYVSGTDNYAPNNDKRLSAYSNICVNPQDC